MNTYTVRIIHPNERTGEGWINTVTIYTGRKEPFVESTDGHEPHNEAPREVPAEFQAGNDQF